MAFKGVGNRNIRLALLRCDTHGYWYGPFMAKCDPMIFLRNNPVCHYYFADMRDPNQLHSPYVPGFEIVRCWDADYRQAQDFSETFLGKPKPCRTIREATEGVDAAFVADCSGDGHDHVKLATPFLKKGIPVFVDKPFAPTYRECCKMIDLAKANKTIVMSASLLEHNPTLKLFRKRFAEIDPVTLVVAKGVGGAGLAGVIHGIALIRNLLGDGVEWVQAMGTTPLLPDLPPELNSTKSTVVEDGAMAAPMTFLNLHYKNGQEALVLNTDLNTFPERCDFFASAYSRGGAIHSPAIGDPEFLAGGEIIVKLFRQMMRTGKPTVSTDSLKEKIAIVEAGRKSVKLGRPVYLKEIMK